MADAGLERPSRARRLDVASLLLLVCGLTFGATAYWLIQKQGVNALVLVPSIAAATIGTTHLFKWQVAAGPSEENTHG